jgi:trimethylamine--corrinoid protein Co-methyltransferase
VPLQLVSMPLAGVTSPVTLASAVVQHTAESLSGIVITQLAQPGARVVWGGAPAAIDMRSGATPMGDPATWLIDSAYIQVGKSFNLPTHTYMGSSDAKIVDAQAGLESAGGTLMAALSGANMVSGAGMLDFLRCQSLEKLVLDAEAIGMAKRILQGIELREQPVALEQMRRSGHKADHLGKPHTIQWMNKELYFPSPVIERGSLESWREKGSTDAGQRAARQVEKILAKARPGSLSPQARRALQEITLAAARRYGMDRLPDLPGEIIFA